MNGQPARMLPGNVFEANLGLPEGQNTVTIKARDGSGNEATKNYSVNVIGGAASYTYDANGNLETKTEGVDVWVCEWNAMNQLIEVKKGTSVQNATMVATFGYDPIGRRILKSTPTKTVAYTYDGADILRENVTTSGSLVTSYYVHGPGIDEPLSKETGASVTYYHADGLGSIAKETDGSGVVTNTLRYDAWGNIETGARDGFAFTGREWDPETGLYYYRARYYDASAASFISEDPIGFGGGDVNLYRYVFGQPTTWADPWGLQVDLNLFPRGDLRSARNNASYKVHAWQAAEDYKGAAQRFTVAGHGMREGYFMPTNSVEWLTPKAMAKRIRGHKNWHGQIVDLLPCETASESRDRDACAQLLADELGTKVIGYSNIDIDDRLPSDQKIRGTYLGSDIRLQMGKVFYPRGNQQ